ncbi:MAG: hypothetical protein RL223_619 [Pseudomonadota bacterium]|jgi:predicted TIM-barrel fold metal-dependent hydrolase
MAFIDSHCHVIAPLDLAPMAPQRTYTPEPADIAQWRDTLAPLGVSHGVLVQPSVYGTDNRVLLAALTQAQAQALAPLTLAGIAAVDADVGDAELDRLQAAGVRGIRLSHFEPGDPRDRGGFVRWPAFEALEPRLAERDLHLQLFTDSRLLHGLAPRLQRSRVPVVIDHMGRAPAALGARHAGLRTLAALMRDAPVWVKLSGIANISDAGPDHADARAVHEALLAAAHERLLWGSDWPHTRPGGVKPSTAALMDLFIAWTPAALRARIGWDNGRALFGF